MGTGFSGFGLPPQREKAEDRGKLVQAQLAFLKDLVEHSNIECAVIYCIRSEERIQISALLGDEAATVPVSANPEKRRAIVEGWKSGKIRWLIAGQTILAGVDLSRSGAQMIFWDEPRTEAENLQLRARISRGGEPTRLRHIQPALKVDTPYAVGLQERIQAAVLRLHSLARASKQAARVYAPDGVELRDLTFGQVSAMWEHNAEAAAYADAASDLERQFPELFA